MQAYKHTAKEQTLWELVETSYDHIDRCYRRIEIAYRLNDTATELRETENLRLAVLENEKVVEKYNQELFKNCKQEK